MRHLLRLLGIVCLAGWALAACAPAQSPPSNPVGRAISQIRNPPMASPTPNVAAQTCLEAYAEIGDDLRAEFMDQMAALDFDPLAVTDAAIEAEHALDLPRSDLISGGGSLPNGDYVALIQWCGLYNDRDLFVVSPSQQVTHLLTVESDRTLSDWEGEGMIVAWANSSGAVLHGQQIWIFEPQADGTWEVVYEKDRMVKGASASPSEITWGQNEVTFDYTLTSGERVIRQFQLMGSDWMLVDEQRIEP